MTSCVAVQALRMCYLPSAGRERTQAREVGADPMRTLMPRKERNTSLLRQK